jgi:hypothetical protein
MQTPGARGPDPALEGRGQSHSDDHILTCVRHVGQEETWVWEIDEESVKEIEETESGV